MKKILITLLFFVKLLPGHCQQLWDHWRLMVAPGSQYLQCNDGTPFFWLGDTGLELFHRLNLAKIKM
jgi:Protein of unknown function (DUF4038)